ncbi:serpin-ZX-like [Cicer arietinum]|uniref:serpin-ZX-like n=1 Tax=Cicer arietinum TaxID=3827 RepID=UPI003CC63EE2
MDIDELISHQTNVSLNITKHLFSKEECKNKNIVFSPLSLQVTLSIVANGTEGPAQHQLLSFLGFKSIERLNSFVSQLIFIVFSSASHVGGPHLSFVNGVWVQESLSLYPSFKEIVTCDYNAALTFVDFLTKSDEVRNEVNLWAEKMTNGFIKSLIPARSIKNTSELIFANALYFKGKWDQDFDTSKTKEYDFHLLNGNSVKVPFMTSTNDHQRISVFDGFKVVGLDYKHGNDRRRFFMYIFLPDTKDGLSSLIEKVTSDSDFIKHKLPFSNVKVGDFRIPTFKISYGVENLMNVVMELGVVLPFSPPGGMTKLVDSFIGKHNFVTNIHHKSFIEVNEEGTRPDYRMDHFCIASGYRDDHIPPRIDFVADHPFFFLIREDLTETILFTGQVLNPLYGCKGTWSMV